MLTDEDFNRAAALLGCPALRIKAVTAVESRGKGFDDLHQPIILFERHWFRKFTDGDYDNHPDISNSKPGGYTQDEHARLAKAVKLNRAAALKSCSWGLFQIMGFNFEACGYTNLQDFVNDMYESESKQLDAFVEFIAHDARLRAAIKSGDAAAFAKAYNGPNYAINKYDQKLIAAGFSR